MSLNTQRLKELAKPRNEQAKKRDQERRMNREWLTYSQDIALALHYYMRVNEMTQRELADKLGVSPVYVVKLLKGGENLTLETICKLQNVLGESLINVVKPYEQAHVIQLVQPYEPVEKVCSMIYYKDLSNRTLFQKSSTRMVTCCG